MATPLPSEIKAPGIPPEQLSALDQARKLLQTKMALLEKFDTARLILNLNEAESAFAKLMEEELAYKNLNRGFIASAGDDCSVVKTKLAELWLDAPEFKGEGSKATKDDKEAWLRTMRTQNPDLTGLIVKQLQVLAGIEDFRIKLEQAKRKVDVAIAIIRLRTAQIEFLGRSI